MKMSQHILYSLSHSHTHRDFNIISFVWNCELKHDLFSTSWSRRLYDSTHQKTPRDGVTNRSYRHAGNEIVLLMHTAYMFALSDAHFPHFLFYIFAGVSSQRALYPVRWPCSGPAESSEVFSLDECAVCLLVFSVENDAITPARHLSPSP